MRSGGGAGWFVRGVGCGVAGMLGVGCGVVGMLGGGCGVVGRCAAVAGIMASGGLDGGMGTVVHMQVCRRLCV